MKEPPSDEKGGAPGRREEKSLAMMRKGARHKEEMAPRNREKRTFRP